MVSMCYSFKTIIIVFILRINSYILNEPDIFYNIKKIFNMFPLQIWHLANPSLDNGQNHIDQSEHSAMRHGYSYSDIFVRETAYSATQPSK